MFSLFSSLGRVFNIESLRAGEGFLGTENGFNSGRHDTPQNIDSPAFHLGDVLPGGWIIGGVSQETGLVYSIEPLDIALEGRQTWHAGQEHAQSLRDAGYNNARQPLMNDLRWMYLRVAREPALNARAGFDLGNCSSIWSGQMVPDEPDHAYLWDFEDGFEDDALENYPFARVRCIRDEPKIPVRPFLSL
ncbi:MAG: hypothetical protein ACLFP8_00695 [Alphaproteobacteria bacterium]